jgi:hypothetical protein
MPRLVVLLCVMYGARALAWDPVGHQLVGALADGLLDASARAFVAREAGFPLAEAAKWPDCARSVEKQGEAFVYAPRREEYRLPCVAFATPSESELLERYVSLNWSNCEYGRYGFARCHESYHQTDLSIGRDRYDRASFGTDDHDIVAAIGAAVAVLQGRPAPKPFVIESRKVALFLLAHFVGDIHQPLHVAAVYLTADGRPVEPQGAAAGVALGTEGGNLLFDAGMRLHTEWDTVDPVLLDSSGPGFASLREAAAQVPPTRRDGRPVPPEERAAVWASETARLAAEVFAGASYAPDPAHPGSWAIAYPDRAAAMTFMAAAQRRQIAKAGARLAELLNAIAP